MATINWHVAVFIQVTFIGCPDQKAFGCYSQVGLPNFESIDGWITMELKPIRNLKYSRQKPQDFNSCHYHDHVINFNNAAIIDNCKLLSIRKLSDSWHTMTTTRADNNSCSLSVLLCLFYLLKNCSLGGRKLAFLKHLKPEKKNFIFLFVDVVNLNIRRFHLKASLHTIGIVISNFVNHTIPSLPSRGRLKGIVALRVKLKAVVVDSDFWLQDSIETLSQDTVSTATRTSLNRRFNEQNDCCARALELLVHFFAVLYKSTTWNDQFSGFFDNGTRCD